MGRWGCCNCCIDEDEDVAVAVGIPKEVDAATVLFKVCCVGFTGLGRTTIGPSPSLLVLVWRDGCSGWMIDDSVATFTGSVMKSCSAVVAVRVVFVSARIWLISSARSDGFRATSVVSEDPEVLESSADGE